MHGTFRLGSGLKSSVGFFDIDKKQLFVVAIMHAVAIIRATTVDPVAEQGENIHDCKS